jgi:DNA polymerase III sliding clamp (beta) subunit (PCNA family)
MLCACLNALDNDKVVMRLRDESHAVVLHDNDNPQKNLLFMPLMLS